MKLLRGHGGDLWTAPVAVVVALTLAAGVTLWLFTLRQIETERSIALQAEIAKNTNLALSHADRASSSIKVLDKILLAVRTDYLTHGRPPNLNALLDGLQVDRTLISVVALLDESGNSMASTLENVQSYTDREYFQHHQSVSADRLLLGQPIVGRLRKQWVITVTRRIDKPDGRFGGVVVMSLTPQFFASEYEKTSQGPYGSMALIGLDGITRARRNANKVSFGEDARASQLFKELPKSPVGHYLGVAASDGVRRLVAYRRLEDQPMVTIVASSYEDVLATTADRERLSFGVAAAASLAMVLGCLASITYLVRRRRIQSVLIAAKEAAEIANVAKSQFLATMSHEIRTPLNVMKGMVYAMRSTGLVPKQEEYLAHIDSAAAHLLTIVSDVLDVAKIEAGKLELESAEMKVGQIAADMVDMLRGDALAKNIDLVIAIDPHIPAVLGDVKRLRQALLNYLGNAIKFTETGTITLRVQPERESDGHVLLRFEVQDTGIGISAHAVSRLFSPFEQADPSDTRQYGGTGLGLVITRRIAELMGGSAGVESIPGVGSTFWFTVRLQKPPRRRSVQTLLLHNPPECSPKQMLQRDFSGQRVLLVEDDAITRRLFQMLLEQIGLIVDAAKDGAVAVDQAANQAYALIVMDMQMPRMGGLEATGRIRAMATGKNVPIIMMTGNAFEQSRTQCVEVGVSDFIAKPVDPEDLFAMILKWLTVTLDPHRAGR